VLEQLHELGARDPEERFARLEGGDGLAREPVGIRAGVARDHERLRRSDQLEERERVLIQRGLEIALERLARTVEFGVRAQGLRAVGGHAREIALSEDRDHTRHLLPVVLRERLAGRSARRSRQRGVEMQQAVGECDRRQVHQ
jgi:hypothetical protein